MIERHNGEVDYYNFSSDAFENEYQAIQFRVGLLTEFEKDFQKYLRERCGDAVNVRNHPFCFRGTDGFLLVEALPQSLVNAVFQTAAARSVESLMEKY